MAMRTILIAAAMGLLLTSASVSAAGSYAAPYQPPRRPVVLPMLYAGFAFLEGFDVHSTITALNDHAREANPVMKAIATQPGPFLAVKVGVTTLSIVSAERLWKQGHRTSAITTIAALNVFMGYVAVHNAQVRRY
jgi:Domain of unknown function (DUF5658)